MSTKKTNFRTNGIAGTIAKGAIAAALALSITPMAAIAETAASATLPPEEQVQGTQIVASDIVQWDQDSYKIVPNKSNITALTFDDWFDSITQVEVSVKDASKGTSGTSATYANEAANIILEDGTLNTLAQTSTGEDGKDIFEAPGSYTITVKGEGGFTDFSFEIALKTAPVKYDDTNIKLVDPSGDITEYTKAITSVTVNGDTYVNGNPEIIKEDGTIDTSAVSDQTYSAFIFYKDSNSVVVRAPGYKDISFDVRTDGSETVYRLYNPYDYLRLYTTDQAEYDQLVSLGWQGEGVAWESPRVSRNGQHVYRLYNQYNGEHLYTTDIDEYEDLGEIGWTQEGVAYDSASGGSESVAVERFYNRYITGVGSTHHYTTDAAEQAQMVKDGWIDEGASFYGIDE